MVSATRDTAMVAPPSTTSTCLLTKAPALEARNTGGTRHILGLPDPPEGIGRLHLRQHGPVLPQCAGEVGPHETLRDAVDADVVSSPLDRKVARKLHLGRLRDGIEP